MQILLVKRVHDSDCNTTQQTLTDKIRCSDPKLG